VDWKELQRILLPLGTDDAETSKQPKKLSKSASAAVGSVTAAARPSKPRARSARKDPEALGGQIHMQGLWWLLLVRPPPYACYVHSKRLDTMQGTCRQASASLAAPAAGLHGFQLDSRASDAGGATHCTPLRHLLSKWPACAADAAADAPPTSTASARAVKRSGAGTSAAGVQVLPLLCTPLRSSAKPVLACPPATCCLPHAPVQIRPGCS
jgi:hypothetical protein